MADISIRVESISKHYRLGTIGGDTLREDISRRWARLRGRPDPLLQLSDSSHRTTENHWALRNVSFEVKQGEVLGIVGRNGAGKSTLLKILSRTTAPTSGRALIKGRIGSLLEVGTGFHPELTGRENIFLNGSILGMRHAEISQKLEEIIEFSGISSFIDTPVKRYSSGMYVRLAFAVAAHLEPEILIVDEVLAVGDAEFQKKCLGKMKDVAGHGRTVLFVSHNMGAVGTLCTTGILLNQGSVEMTGTAEDVVIRYIDSTATRRIVDFAEFRVPGEGEQTRFEAIDMAGEAAVFDYGEALRIRLKISTDRDREYLSIGASIYNQYEETVGTLFTEDTFNIARGEIKELQLTISTPRLAPGNYKMSWSVGRGGFRSVRHNFDVVIGAPSFTVAPRASTGMLGPWHRAWGSIHFSETALEPVSEPLID